MKFTYVEEADSNDHANFQYRSKAYGFVDYMTVVSFHRAASFKPDQLQAGC